MPRIEVTVHWESYLSIDMTDEQYESFMKRAKELSDEYGYWLEEIERITGKDYTKDLMESLHYISSEWYDWE